MRCFPTGSWHASVLTEGCSYSLAYGFRIHLREYVNVAGAMDNVVDVSLQHLPEFVAVEGSRVKYVNLFYNWHVLIAEI